MGQGRYLPIHFGKSREFGYCLKNKFWKIFTVSCQGAIMGMVRHPSIPRGPGDILNLQWMGSCVLNMNVPQRLCVRTLGALVWMVEPCWRRVVTGREFKDFIGKPLLFPVCSGRPDWMQCKQPPVVSTAVSSIS